MKVTLNFFNNSPIIYIVSRNSHSKYSEKIALQLKTKQFKGCCNHQRSFVGFFSRCFSVNTTLNIAAQSHWFSLILQKLKSNATEKSQQFSSHPPLKTLFISISAQFVEPFLTMWHIDAIKAAVVWRSIMWRKKQKNVQLFQWFISVWSKFEDDLRE